MAGTIDINELYDTIDAVITHLCQEQEIDELRLQKSVFLFLWQYALKHKQDPMGLLSQFQFLPYKEGPFSDYVHGQLEVLAREGDLTITKAAGGNKLRSSKHTLHKYHLNEAESRLANEIRHLVSKTGPKELAFYIYYNPTIPKSLREFFTSRSELKEEFKKNKLQYLSSLLRNELIDEDAYAIMYEEVA